MREGPREDSGRRGALQSKDVEVKWGVHRRGETNGAFATNAMAQTLSVLVRGKFRLSFKSRASLPL